MILSIFIIQLVPFCIKRFNMFLPKHVDCTPKTSHEDDSLITTKLSL